MVKRFSGIKDWMGRLVKRNQVGKDQTTGLGAISKEFANHPSRGLTPGRLASILKRAEGGDLVGQMDLFEDMEEKDAHIYAELTKRKRVLQGLDWSLVPPRNPSAAELKQTEQLQEWFDDLDNFEDIIFDMADAIGKGYSNLEIEWRLEQGIQIPHPTHRPPRWFTVNKDNRNQLLLRNNTGKGEVLWPFNWVSHIHKAKSGYVTRGGLHRVLAWPYLFKNYSVRDLAEFLEIYGIPLRLGTYPSGASEKEKMTLLRAVTSIGHNAAGIMPEGMMMEFKEAASGGSDPFTDMINWADTSQSKAILGGTLTTIADSTGLGSNLGDIHNEVRHDLRDSDARQIAGTITRDLIWPMAALNIAGADPRRAPRFEFDTQEPEDIVMMSEALPKLVGIGMRVTPEWAHEKLQIPMAEDGDQVLGVKEEPLPPEEPGQAATAAASAATPEPDATNLAAQQLQDDTAPSINAMLDRIKELLDEVETIEEFQDRLVEAFNYMDMDELSEAIQLGMSAAELAGRFDVQEGE